MSEQIQIGVKVDKNLKDEVDGILRSLGIKPTAAIAGLYTYISQHKELPFVINIQADKPSALISNLLMDYSLLKRLLSEFYVKIESEKPVTGSELKLLKNAIHEFNTNFRQIEKALFLLNQTQLVDWKKAYNGAKRAFYVLEAYLNVDLHRGYQLKEEEIIKLALALKMIQEAEIDPTP